MDPTITANMRIREVLARFPRAAHVLNAYGIRCEACHAAQYESLAQGARVHGIDLPTLLADLNQATATRGHHDRLPHLGN